MSGTDGASGRPSRYARGHAHSRDPRGHAEKSIVLGVRLWGSQGATVRNPALPMEESGVLAERAALR
jgi:hypothetical protein